MINQNNKTPESSATQVAELSGRRTIHHVVSSRYTEWRQQSTVWRPPTDVFETQSEIVVRLEVAGMVHADFTISVDENVLAVRGVREMSQQSGVSYHQIEINTGEFLSLVSLTLPITIETITAKYEDGILQIKLPRLIAGKTKK